jgi:hypothetical protein
MIKLFSVAILITPLLVGCPELNKLLNGKSSESSTAKVTAKRFAPSNCAYVEPLICKADEYGLYYTDDTYSSVSKETYEKAKIGDPK